MRPGRDNMCIYIYIYAYMCIYIYIYISATSCDSVAQVRRWSPSCVRRRPWRTKQVHEVDQTSHPTPRHSFVALSMPRSAQCPCKRKGGEEERRSLTSIQTSHTHTHHWHGATSSSNVTDTQVQAESFEKKAICQVEWHVKVSVYLGTMKHSCWHRC